MADTDKEQDAQQQSDDMSDSKKVQERIAERAKRAEELREMGIDPYPYSFEQTHSARQILDAFNDLEAGEKTDEKVAVAGRLMTIRNMGKIAFAHIQDQTGRIQVFFRQNDIGKDLFTLLKKIDIGDFLGVQGHVFATKTGETSVYVESFTVLTKSVRDLPEKYHGLKDPELRYRQRYLDLAMNQDVRDVFFKRSLMIRAIREFFAERGFVEVETPALQLVYGGANARPFTTHINAWKMDMFLSISPELYLKRLVVGGFEKVFTICKNFRNE
ncbi:MAG: amino acid--tRNA ligase-related protein, partial [Nanoarchaeota archaeon]